MQGVGATALALIAALLGYRMDVIPRFEPSSSAPPQSRLGADVATTIVQSDAERAAARPCGKLEIREVSAPVGAALQYYSGFMSQLKRMEAPKNAWPGFPRQSWPIVRNHTDPTDILKPEVYELNDPAWMNPGKLLSMARHCR